MNRICVHYPRQKFKFGIAGCLGQLWGDLEEFTIPATSERPTQINQKRHEKVAVCQTDGRLVWLRTWTSHKGPKALRRGIIPDRGAKTPRVARSAGWHVSDSSCLEAQWINVFRIVSFCDSWVLNCWSRSWCSFSHWWKTVRIRTYRGNRSPICLFGHRWWNNLIIRRRRKQE